MAVTKTPRKKPVLADLEEEKPATKPKATPTKKTATKKPEAAEPKTVEPKDSQTYWLHMFPYADPRSRAEIEAALHAIPGVHDCAVFGIPDAEFGEALLSQGDAGRHGMSPALHQKAVLHRSTHRLAEIDAGDRAAGAGTDAAGFERNRKCRA